MLTWFWVLRYVGCVARPFSAMNTLNKFSAAPGRFESTKRFARIKAPVGRQIFVAEPRRLGLNEIKPVKRRNESRRVVTAAGYANEYWVGRIGHLIAPFSERLERYSFAVICVASHRGVTRNHCGFSCCVICQFVRPNRPGRTALGAWVLIRNVTVMKRV